MRHILALCFCMLSIHVNATQQIPEEFEVDGASFNIEELPLDSFIIQNNRKKDFDEKAYCSANWRGYKGYWSLRDNKLFLTYLVKNACDERPVRIESKKLFDQDAYPVHAQWFTGNINVRIGPRKYYDTKTTGLSGYEFEAVVYEFHLGELLSREIKMVQFLWH